MCLRSSRNSARAPKRRARHPDVHGDQLPGRADRPHHTRHRRLIHARLCARREAPTRWTSRIRRSGCRKTPKPRSDRRGIFVICNRTTTIRISRSVERRRKAIRIRSSSFARPAASWSCLPRAPAIGARARGGRCRSPRRAACPPRRTHRACGSWRSCWTTSRVSAPGARARAGRGGRRCVDHARGPRDVRAHALRRAARELPVGRAVRDGGGGAACDERCRARCRWTSPPGCRCIRRWLCRTSTVSCARARALENDIYDLVWRSAR